jgi:hypothetical protein
MDNQYENKRVRWQPQEIIDIGNGLIMGIASDDGHYIVLSPDPGGTWKPASCIPLRVAKRLGELANAQIASALFANAP